MGKAAILQPLAYKMAAFITFFYLFRKLKTFT